MRCLRDETEVGDAALVAYEPFLRREHALEHAEDTQDLLLVAFNGTRNLLGRKEHEPARLAEVRAAGDGRIGMTASRGRSRLLTLAQKPGRKATGAAGSSLRTW